MKVDYTLCCFLAEIKLRTITSQHKSSYRAKHIMIRLSLAKY
jgi:hypothetical protein